MNEGQANQQNTVGGRERCLCFDVFDLVRERLGISPAVKEHLANSRIELLKAARAVIDERIERLSTKGQQGTKIAIE
jgi:hypothetical protein